MVRGFLFTLTTLVLLTPTSLLHAQEEDERRFRALVRRFFQDTENQQSDSMASKAVGQAIGLPEGVGNAVALEHTILQRTPGGERAVDAVSHRFRLGDEIRVRIEPLSDVYIYIFNRGPGGRLTALLPEDDETPPHVKAGRSVVLPDDGYFEFVPPAGSEELLVIATHEPVASLQALAGSLMHKSPEELTPAEKTEANRITQAAQSALNHVFEVQTTGARHRGLMTPEAQAELATKVREVSTASGARSRQITVEEPPHANEGSTLAVAATPPGTERPKLMVTITLKSMGE